MPPSSPASRTVWRSIYVISGLLRSKIDFLSADCPNRTHREILLHAIEDEEEASRTAERTKRGMQIARERGVKFGFARPDVEMKAGHLRGYKKASFVAGKVRHERCLQTYEVLIFTIRELLADGLTYSRIADELNKMGHLTTWGKPFHGVAVYRVLKMFSRRPRRWAGVADAGENSRPRERTSRSRRHTVSHSPAPIVQVTRMRPNTSQRYTMSDLIDESGTVVRQKRSRVRGKCATCGAPIPTAKRLCPACRQEEQEDQTRASMPGRVQTEKRSNARWNRFMFTKRLSFMFRDSSSR